MLPKNAAFTSERADDGGPLLKHNCMALSLEPSERVKESLPDGAAAELMGGMVER